MPGFRFQENSKDVAAVVSMGDLKTLEALEDRLDLEEAEQIMKKPGRLVAWERVKSGFGLGCATPSPGPPRLTETPGRSTLSPRGERAKAPIFFTRPFLPQPKASIASREVSSSSLCRQASS